MVPLWSLGLNGSGVVLATADSGLDLDHTCFRNGTTEVGVPGPDHRKILVLNTTVHDADAPGHDDYRHGTHTAGTLGCEPVDWNRSQAPDKAFLWRTVQPWWWPISWTRQGGPSVL